MLDMSHERARMVERQIAGRGVQDPRVLAAMRTVPRELFVPYDRREDAYEDRPLSIGKGQTISQPYIVAAMIEALELQGGEKVLEVGAGSGYAAAVLAEIASEVFAIERIGDLAQGAIDNLARARCDNVLVLHADGTKGWPEEAPFDAILVSAGATVIPEALKDQLAIGGRMVIPVDDGAGGQVLVRLKRRGEDKYERDELGDVRFVPLIADA